MNSTLFFYSMNVVLVAGISYKAFKFGVPAGKIASGAIPVLFCLAMIYSL